MHRVAIAWRWAVRLLYAASMLYATYLGFTAPYCNWDMLGYVGSVVAWHDKDSASIYDDTMATVKDNVTDWIYKDYKSNPLSAEDKAFFEQLPIYQVKPLYNGLIWLVHQTGIALPKASWIISATCFGLLGMRLFLWQPHYMSQQAWLLFILALTFIGDWPMAHIARLSTPDCIATLLETAALYCWLMRRSFPLYCMFAWLALLARPDALILCGAWAAYFAVIPASKDRMPLTPTIALLCVLCITYFTVSRVAGNYGLERWFIYAFIDKTPYPAEATDHLTLQRYWDVLAPSTLLFIGMWRTIIMGVFSLISVLCHSLRPTPDNQLWLHIILLNWGCLILRFLMFPGWGEDRYYFVYYLPILFAGGECMAPYAALLRQRIVMHLYEVFKAP